MANEPRKSSGLYWLILAASTVLITAMVKGSWGDLSRAYQRSLWVGAGHTVCVALIACFWVDGVKNLAYPLWYHLRMKRKGPREVPARPAGYLPKVVMIYCTCNDFNAESLQASMVQSYDGEYEVVILDDSRKPEYVAMVDAFAAEHGLRVIRRPDNAGYKAGNINHGLAQLDYDYVVILDSDEIIPADFIDRALDYIVQPGVGIVQANHRATRNRNPFMKRFAIGVDSFWWTFQSVKDQHGFMSLLGHGAMVSRECLEATGGMPMLVAEDISLSIEARTRGFLTVFAPDIMCEEEFPVDFLAFKKRHNKWTQGNMEFIKRYTRTILTSKMTWFEKLDIVLFTYSLPLTGLFVVYLADVLALGYAGDSLALSPWMLAPTLAFLAAPMLNDVIYHYRDTSKRELLTYLGQSTLLFGSMFFVSLRASAKSLFGKSVFLVTPKEDQKVGFRMAVRSNLVELVAAVGLSLLGIYLTGNLLAVFFLVVPALFMAYLSLIHQPVADRPDPVDAELDDLLAEGASA